MTRRDASEMRVQGDTITFTEIVGPKQDDDDDDDDDDALAMRVEMGMGTDAGDYNDNALSALE